MDKTKLKQFKRGAVSSLPIAIGYIPVSFSFGMLAVKAGIPPIWAIIISMTNLTSAGQFAGVNIIGAAGSYLEMGVTTFIINLRYMLMSLALTQKTQKMSLGKRLISAFGITDEIFAVASTTSHEITFSFMAGLIIVPYFGWALGTALGAYINEFLPEFITDALGITLYAMFIAIIIPAARKNFRVLIVLAVSVAISCAIYFLMPFISPGWAVIIAAVIASAIGAFLFPRKEEDA